MTLHGAYFLILKIIICRDSSSLTEADAQTDDKKQQYKKSHPTFYNKEEEKDEK